ncbi:hypothetical protein U9M48_037615, partial [Paspalum notatum var. saurae]
FEIRAHHFYPTSRTSSSRHPRATVAPRRRARLRRPAPSCAHLFLPAHRLPDAPLPCTQPSGRAIVLLLYAVGGRASRSSRRRIRPLRFLCLCLRHELELKPRKNRRQISTLKWGIDWSWSSVCADVIRARTRGALRFASLAPLPPRAPPPGAAFNVPSGDRRRAALIPTRGDEDYQEDLKLYNQHSTGVGVVCRDDYSCPDGYTGDNDDSTTSSPCVQRQRRLPGYILPAVAVRAGHEA